MRIAFASSLTVLTVAVTLSACSGATDSLGPENAALVQFVNGASSGMITVETGGETIATLGARSASAACVFVPAGSQTLVATFGANPSASIAHTFTAGQRYTVVMWPGPVAPALTRTVVTEVQPTVSAGTMRVRFFNLSDVARDVYAQVPTGTLAANPMATLQAEAMTGGSSGVDGFLSIPSENTRMLWYQAGLTGAAEGDATIGFQGLVTVVFVPQGTVNSRVFAFTPCTT